MRNTLRKKLFASLIVLATSLTTGCLFDGDFPLSVALDEDGTLTLAFSTRVTGVRPCDRDSLTITCEFPDGTEAEFELVGQIAGFVIFLDPLIVQLQSDATEFSGSFLHLDSGISGNLQISAGLASVRADFTNDLVAEPGTQLVIIDFPAGAPPTGDFDFNLNFKLPPGTASLAMKPMLTGRVETDGQTFYPPLLPCVTDFANAPAVNTPLPAPNDEVTLPSLTGLGCNNVTYNFGNAPPPPPPPPPPEAASIPTLTEWGLILMVGLIGFMGVYFLRRER